MEVLIVFLLAAHLLAMNLAGAGPLVSLYFEWWEAGEAKIGATDEMRSDDIPLAGRAGRWLTDLSLIGYVIGMLIGGALLTLVWTRDERHQLAENLASRISFGIAELVFSLVLMGLASLWWRWTGRGAGWSRWTYRLACVLSATNLLYHFPLLFAVADHLIAARDAVAGELPSASFRGLAFSGEIISRALHFLLASFAACGVAVMVFAAREPAAEPGEAASEKEKELDGLAIAGAWLALATTFLQPIVGWWVMVSLPAVAQQKLMGGDLVHTLLFLGGVGTGLGLMHPLFAAASGDKPRESALLSVLLFLTTVLCMTATLRMAVGT